jgi:hypothetical protein
LINILGTTGETNVQGETVKKLDAIANDTFVKVFQHSGFVCALASEEMEKPISLPGNWPHGKYMLLFDPLDGSSNTDCNMPLGAIFSVLKYDRTDRLPTEEEMIRKGTEQVAAGYLLYGASTMLVYTVGQGVYGFTLEPGIGEYLLSHEQIRIPERGKVYAVNEGNYLKRPEQENIWTLSRSTIKHRVVPIAAGIQVVWWPTCTAYCSVAESISILVKSINQKGSFACCTKRIPWRSLSSGPVGKRRRGRPGYWTSSRRNCTSACR